MSYFALALLAILAVSFITVRVEIDEQHQYAESLRATTSEQLGRLASNLQSNINGNVKLAQGVVAAISANPDIDQASFEQFCAQLFKEKSQLRNIGAAPDLVVRLIYPVAPNIKSLGLDYRTNAQQRDAALQVRDARATILTGPVNLVQGGIGLIARYPVFVQDRNGVERFWGIVSAVMDLDKLYADSGLLAQNLPIDIVIAKTSPDISAGAFFGDVRLFNRNPVLHTIDLGYDTWTLAAVPKGGWSVSPPGLAISRLGLLLIALFVVGPLIWAGYLMKQRHGSILALQAREDKLETLSHRLQLALEASKIGVWEFDESTGDLLFDNRMRELFDIPSGKISAGYDDWRNALHPDDIEAAERRFEVALRTEAKYETEFRILIRNGETRHIRGYGITYRSSVGTKRIVGANWDVTDDVLLQKELKDAHAHAEVQNRRLAEASKTLSYQSVHDALTGLPNRRYLDQYLEQPSPTPGHVFLHVDLDRFKEVNDTLGHAAGDRVLQIAASRLLAALDAGEFVARIGGDEFIVVATSDDPETRGRALGLSILDAFSRPLVDPDFECQVGASIGVASQRCWQTDLRQLIINADVALYEAKKLGRNLTRDVRGEARIVERAFGIGPSALTEAVTLLGRHLERQAA